MFVKLPNRFSSGRGSEKAYIGGSLHSYMTIVAALDGTQRDDPTVHAGYDLAQAFDTELYLLHVIPEDEFDDHLEEVVPEEHRGEYSFSQAEDSAARLAGDILSESLTVFESGRIETVGRVGDPMDQIIDVAEQVNAEYLVIDGRTQSTIGKAVFGDTAQRILHNAELPVVSVMDQ